MDRRAPREPTLGELMRGYRDRAGLTQDALAERAGIHARTVGNIERDQHTPQANTLNRLAEELGLPQADRDALRAARRRSLAPPPSGATAPPSRRRRFVLAGAVALAGAGVIAGLVAMWLVGRDPGSASLAVPTPTGLSGRWVDPEPGFVVQDGEVRFAARAWPTNPLDQPVEYVNFTVTWDGPEGGWRSACAAFSAKPGTPDTYECVWTLPPNVPDGPITVSFDVYGEAGNLNKAPHGKRGGTVQRQP